MDLMIRREDRAGIEKRKENNFFSLDIKGLQIFQLIEASRKCAAFHFFFFFNKKKKEKTLLGKILFRVKSFLISLEKHLEEGKKK